MTAAQRTKKNAESFITADKAASRLISDHSHYPVSVSEDFALISPAFSGRDIDMPRHIDNDLIKHDIRDPMRKRIRDDKDHHAERNRAAEKDIPSFLAEKIAEAYR
jgi:hypothetical protein